MKTARLIGEAFAFALALGGLVWMLTDPGIIRLLAGQ